MSLGGTGIDGSSAAISKVMGPQWESTTPPEVSPIVTPEGVILLPWDAKPVYDQALVTSACGAAPSIRATSITVEGDPNLEVMTPDDFMLRLEALKAFASILSLLRSGDIE